MKDSAVMLANSENNSHENQGISILMINKVRTRLNFILEVKEKLPDNSRCWQTHKKHKREGDAQRNKKKDEHKEKRNQEPCTPRISLLA